MYVAMWLLNALAISMARMGGTQGNGSLGATVQSVDSPCVHSAYVYIYVGMCICVCL